MRSPLQQPRRLVAVIREQHTVVGYLRSDADAMALEIEELARGAIVPDLTASELASFGHMFALVSDDAPAPPATPHHTRRTA